MKLYRAMKCAADGFPEVGPSARALGVRGLEAAPDNDVPVKDPGDAIRPGEGGMSVAPADPMHLKRHRRPTAFGGTGKDPLWEVDDADLGADVRFRRDSPSHGVIEPAYDMTFAEFREALAATRTLWQLTT